MSEQEKDVGELLEEALPNELLAEHEVNAASAREKANVKSNTDADDHSVTDEEDGSSTDTRDGN